MGSLFDRRPTRAASVSSSFLAVPLSNTEVTVKQVATTMNNTAVTRAWSDLPIPPGEVLQEETEALGMNQTQLAVALGRPVQAVNEIIRGKKAITQETALELERVLDIGVHVWTGLESAYRMTLARNREQG